MRQIKEAIIHCTYTKPSMSVGVAMVNEWHEARGFMSPSGIPCGYHELIRRDGSIEIGRPHSEIGAHCRGHNSHSIGIALEGGMSEDGEPDSNFTIAQFETLSMRQLSLELEYPRIVFKGHRDYSDKACPCFSVQALLGD